MKNYSIIILFFCLAINCSLGQSTNIDITSYDIKVNYEINKWIIDITANLEIEKTVNSNSFSLLLGSWAKIKSVKSGDEMVEFTRKSPDNDTLQISLPAQFGDSKSLNLTFDYTLILDSLGLENKDVILLQRNTLWYPQQFDDIASMKIDITAPINYSVFALGNLINKKTSNANVEYSFENKQNNRYALLAIKSDTFNTILTKKIENVNINFFFVSNDTSLTSKIITDVCKSFSFYNKFIGSYKYNQLNVVEVPANRMMYAQSLSSLLMMGSPFLETYKFEYWYWPAHEVAHQWWGNGVFTNSRVKKGLFLEETVNEYFKTLYVENILGNDSLKSLIKSYHDRYNEIDKSKELSILEITKLSTMENGYVIYQKGPLVMNKLRNLMGIELYEIFIKDIYNNYFGKMLTYDEFIGSLSKYDKNDNLVITLNKWLSETGYEE